MTGNIISRRRALCHLVGAAALPAALASATPAVALATSDAEAFVQAILEDLRGLIRADDAGPDGAAQFLAMLEDRAALPQVARFAAGRSWRDMSSGQQGAYEAAFRDYLAKTYQKRFGDYAGEDIVVSSSRDLGKKGVLVKSALTRPNGQSFDIEWLVSDRAGPVKLADIVFEGVSLSVTLRELFGGMIDKHNGDIDQFIADLKASEGA